MAKGRGGKGDQRAKPATTRGLWRVTAYLHTDELQAVEREARRQRCSKSEVTRRLIRRHFGIDD